MYIRKLRKNIGLFSNINNAIRHIIYVDEFGENPFYIQWKSAFYQSNSGKIYGINYLINHSLTKHQVIIMKKNNRAS